MSVELINIGCIITSIMVPDRSGKMGNVVAGFENWEQYLCLLYTSDAADE